MRSEPIILTSFFVAMTIILGTIGAQIDFKTAQATGGGEVIELVIPMIDETVQSIQNNDTQKALSQLDEIKTELKDTFFAEEEEEED